MRKSRACRLGGHSDRRKAAFTRVLASFFFAQTDAIFRNATFLSKDFLGRTSCRPYTARSFLEVAPAPQSPVDCHTASCPGSYCPTHHKPHPHLALCSTSSTPDYYPPKLRAVAMNIASDSPSLVSIATGTSCAVISPPAMMVAMRVAS